MIRKWLVMGIVWAVIFISGGEAIRAGESADVFRWTLAEVLDRLDRTNPVLQAAAHRHLAAEADAAALSRTRWGELRGNWSVSRFNDNQILRPMSRELMSDGMSSIPFDRTQQHYGLQFQIPLFLGGKLHHSIRIARLEAEKQALLRSGTRWQVRFNAVSLYASGVATDRAISAAEEQLRWLEETRRRLALMVSSGKRPRIDLLKVREALESALARKAALVAQRRKLGGLLLALLGENPRNRIELSELPENENGVSIPEDVLRERLDAVTPVRRAALAAEQAGHRMAVERSLYYPRVFARGNVMEHAAPSLDDPLDTWNAELGISIPLFSGGSRPARYRAARERKQAAERMVEKAEREVQAAFEEALAQFRAAEARRKAAEARLAAAEEAARIEQIRYDTGAGDIEDLLAVRSRYEGAAADLARARADFRIAAERINTIVEEEVIK